MKPRSRCLRNPSLGGYSIQAAENGYGWFEVEEYVAAPFKAEVQPVESEYMAGGKAEFDLSARYYFDMPVADAEVEYTVLAQDYYFDRYTDEYFNFGADWYSCYWCGYGDSFITRGTVTLTAEGTARIEFPLDFATQFRKSEQGGEQALYRRLHVSPIGVVNSRHTKYGYCSSG